VAPSPFRPFPNQRQGVEAPSASSVEPSFEILIFSDALAANDGVARLRVRLMKRFERRRFKVAPTPADAAQPLTLVRLGGAVEGLGVGVTRRHATRLAMPAILVLLDGFELRCQTEPVRLPMTAQRLLAFLALHDRPVPRSHVAGALWMDATEEHATASLRSVLWRLRRPGHAALIQANPSHLRLASGVTVDYHQAIDYAHEVMDEATGDEVLDNESDCLARELLPDWWEEWVQVERERYRQLRLHALEVRCRRLAQIGRFAQAVQAGLAAVACEPLRDSAHQLLISVHLAEGNRTEALRQYHRYCSLLHDELGLPPAPKIQQLIDQLLTQVSVGREPGKVATVVRAASHAGTAGQVSDGVLPGLGYG
jgi:DNA-binding SARP family transcriptional activator